MSSQRRSTILYCGLSLEYKPLEGTGHFSLPNRSVVKNRNPPRPFCTKDSNSPAFFIVLKSCFPYIPSHIFNSSVQVGTLFGAAFAHPTFFPSFHRKLLSESTNISPVPFFQLFSKLFPSYCYISHTMFSTLIHTLFPVCYPQKIRSTASVFHSSFELRSMLL